MTANMQAAVWHGKKDIRVETVPVPPAPAARLGAGCGGLVRHLRV